MSANATITHTMTEAPFSWNTTYADPRGFNCQMTIRTEDGKELMAKVNAVLDWLLEQGCLPADKYGNPVGKTAAQPVASNGNGHTHGAEWCSVHGVEMKSFQKDGRSWYSHKTDDGHWCKGASKN